MPQEQNNNALAKLQEFESNEAAERMARSNRAIETMTTVDARQLQRVHTIVSQAELDIRNLLEEEKELHEALKTNKLYRQLLLTRKKIAIAKKHRREGQKTATVFYEFIQQRAMLAAGEGDNHEK